MTISLGIAVRIGDKALSVGGGVLDVMHGIKGGLQWELQHFSENKSK